MLLLGFTEFYKGTNTTDLVDVFAGAARCAKVARAMGLEASALDLSYSKNQKVFDINENGGFSLLDGIIVLPNLYII